MSNATQQRASDTTSLDTLKQQVLDANLELVRQGLVLFTFGNASGIDRQRGLVVIKPSGVDYAALAPSDMVVTDLDGKVVEGKLRPSSDLATHLILYKEFPGIGGVVHTHSEFATAWAQAGREIPAYGTTHADYFYGPVPVTEELTPDEIGGEYVYNTGVAITRRFQGVDPHAIPAVLVAGHNAAVLETVARMAYYTATLREGCAGVSQALLDRHYFRKHGAKATYGQEK
jgi:L-ribulose-5-phosphate 4-epimerase